MKRMLIVLLVAVLSIGMLFAAKGDKLGEDQTLKVSLDLSGGEGQTTFYDFGFSSTEVGNGKEENGPAYDPTPVEGNELSLTLPAGAETTGRIASHSDEIWAYWHITSGTGLSIDIKGDGVMEMSGAGETNDDIDWNIALDSAQTGTDQATKQNVYTHEPTENGVGADGSRKITLTTEDLTGLALAPGKYTANLVLSITQS